MRSYFGLGIVATAMTLVLTGVVSAQTSSETPYVASSVATPYGAPPQSPYGMPPQSAYGTPNSTPYGGVNPTPYAIADVTSGDYCPWHNPLLSLADVFGFPCACEESGECPATWDVAVEGLYMNRHNTESTPLLYNQSDSSVRLYDNDLQQDFHTGMRLTAARRWGNTCELELTYFGIGGFSGSQSMNTDGIAFYAPDITVTPVGGGQFQFDYRSQIHSGEFLLRHRQDWLGYSAGIRLMEVQEELTGTLLRGAFPPETIWQTHANNHLIGFQAGADVTLLRRTERFRANVAMKIGVYNNHASQMSRTDVGGYASVVSEDDLAAYVGEIDFTAAFKISTHLALRGGYQLMWIDNVALAPQQIGFNNLPAGSSMLYADGQVFAHGASVGLELSY